MWRVEVLQTDRIAARSRTAPLETAAFAHGNIAEPEERYYHDGTTCHGGVAQTKWPRTNPGWFIPAFAPARFQVPFLAAGT